MDIDREFKKKYSEYKSNAKSRSVSFDIPISSFIHAVTKPCYVCGFYDENKLNGVDRVDNNKGYEKLNIAACCWNCNRAKSNQSLSEFKEWMSRLGKVKDSIIEAELFTHYNSRGCSNKADMGLMMFDDLMAKKRI